jgi:hypothetical protein
VENPDPRAQFELPHAAGQLGTHLADVGHAAEDLLGEISERLQTALVPTPVEDHFADPQSFDAHKAATQPRFWLQYATTDRMPTSGIMVQPDFMH